MRWPLVVVLLYAAWTSAAIRLQYDSAMVHGQSLRQRFFAGDSTTTIDFQCSTTNLGKSKGYFEAVIMHGDAILNYPGTSRLHPGVLSFCCSEEYHKAGLCPVEDLLVVPKQQSVVAHYLIPFGADFRTQVHLNTTGPHALLLSNCSPDSTALSGSIEIKSAGGYLPLHLYNLSKFYNVAVWLAGVSLVALVIALIPFRTGIHVGHGVVAASMVFAIVECSLWTKSMAFRNETDIVDASLESLAVFCALLRRIGVFLSVALALYGYGVSSAFRIGDLSPIDRKHLTFFTSFYVTIQVLCWMNLEKGSFVQAYELSRFFVPLLVDLVFLTLLVRPALRTKALLSGTRPRTPAVAAFDRLFMLMAAMLLLFIVNCAISISLAENRGNIRHPFVAFLFPEAILHTADLLMVISVALCTFPLGQHVANLTEWRWPLPLMGRRADSRNPDELAPLGSSS